MSFVAKCDVRFNAGRGEATWVLPAATFSGMDAVDRQVLSGWLDGAGGIDTVKDLTDRPWNIAGVQAIFGVFETGNDQASWLIVQSASGWALARPVDGSVSDELGSLPAILRLIDEQRSG
jgi:hypothetical protein